MRIRRGAWHLRVFLQAYVRDRGWIDAFWEPSRAPKNLPESLASREYEETLKKEHPETHENIIHPGVGMSLLAPELREKLEHYQKLIDEELKAFIEWRRTEWQRHHEQRAAEVETRLYAGRMSLCPYFWSVVFALVFYYPVVRPTRGAWRVATFFVPALAWLATRILVALLVGLVGYGLYAGRNTIPQIPSNVVASVKEEYASYQRRRKAEAKYETERRQEEQRAVEARLEWERAHPEEMRQRREAEAERLRQIATYETERSVRDRQRFWADAKDAAGKLGIGVVYLALGIAGLVVVGAILVLILGGIWALISTPFVALGKLLADSALARRLAQARAAWRQFWTDTRELVGAFIKAKKERVCPFLMIENGSEQH